MTSDKRTNAGPGTATESELLLDGRGMLYAVLGRGFSMPDEGTMKFFDRFSGEWNRDGGELSAHFGALLEAARAATAQRLRAAYMRIFDPVAGPFPYESEFRPGLSDISKSQTLADINGFYRAFGIEPRLERPDHIAVECEFLHLLTLKQRRALAAGDDERASLCEDAFAKFFHDHLDSWVDRLAAALERSAETARHPFYAHLVDLLRLFIESERENLK